MCHVCSLELMVKGCSFNDYHQDFTNAVKSSLLNLSSCQSSVVSSLISPSSVTNDDFTHQIINLQETFKSLRSAYVAARVRRVEQALKFATTLQSEDSLSHAFFLFELGAVEKLLTETITNINSEKNIPKMPEKKKISLKERLKPHWSRLLSSFKCAIIIGVGSIFVLVPPLAKAFENGQLILITLCMTQGDTVGGAFTTMKMRFIGTLLGT